jgi:hypothetical protein
MKFSLKSIALSAALIVAAASGSGGAIARDGGPFTPFLGDWRGAGHVTTKDGKSESINCRAHYQVSPEGAELTQSLVCASDSYRFDVQCHVIADGKSVAGTWRETSRNIDGNLIGQIDNGAFTGNVDGPGFKAALSLRTNGRKQSVDIRPGEGDITSVSVALTRGG